MTCNCPLCDAPEGVPYHADRVRDYRQCSRCALVWVPPAQRLDRAAELAEYRKHCNRLDDPRYRRFLERLAMPLLARLRPASSGLDFGCGPAPLLAAMLEEHGHRVALYDSFFQREPAVLDKARDFITATEVVEHLHAPAQVLERLWDRLRPGGWLGLMTKLVRDREAFASWHYIRDPTHVCFFSRETLGWWGERHAAELSFVGDDVILLRKPPASER